MKGLPVLVAAVGHVIVFAALGWIRIELPQDRHCEWGDGLVRLELTDRRTEMPDTTAPPPPLLPRDVIPESKPELITPPEDLGAAEGDETDETLAEGGEPPPSPSIGVDGGPNAHPKFSTFVKPGAWRGGKLGRGRRGASGTGGGTALIASLAPAPPQIAPAVEAPPREPVRVNARLVEHPQPRYPESARSGRVQGVVRLAAEVLANGTVGAVRVLESSGSTVLDDAAIAGVRRWTFEPATIDGVAVATEITLPPIRFRIR